MCAKTRPEAGEIVDDAAAEFYLDFVCSDRRSHTVNPHYKLDLRCSSLPQHYPWSPEAETDESTQEVFVIRLQAVGASPAEQLCHSGCMIKRLQAAQLLRLR